MKTNRILSILLALVISITVFITPASAEEAHDHGDVEIIFHDENVSEKFKERATECLLNDECECCHDDSATYGLTCDLLGHNLETSNITKIKHQMYASAPRCSKQVVSFSQCTRCDYHTSTVIQSQRINCCA